MSSLDVQLIRGADAERLLADAGFVAAWSGLLDRCPWATGFQTPDYAIAWYRVYQDRFEPLLLFSRDADGTLRGMLAMGVARKGGRVCVAGDVQAEYQAWLAEPEQGDDFIRAALATIWRAFPSATLRLSYLAPGAPMGWLQQPPFNRRSLLRPHRRPLLELGDGSDIAASLKKKSNKNRLNQMKKVGALEFKEVTDPAERQKLLAELIPFHDARHLAMRGSGPFMSDPFMGRFSRALLEAPGLIHVTSLRFGEVLACAHLGMRSRHEIELGLMAHNPWLGRFSPGKFHILFLGQMLQKQGYQRIDLTAGGDAYKERFATGADTVYSLTLFPGAVSRWRGEMRDGARQVVKRLLKTAGMTPNQARAALSRLGLKRRGTVAVQETSPAAANGSEAIIRRDCLEDLLCYRSPNGGATVAQFVSDALRRIEEGQHVYSHMRQGRLIEVGWFIEPSEAPVNGDGDSSPENANNTGQPVAEIQACADESSSESVDRVVQRMIQDAALSAPDQTVRVLRPKT